MTHGVRDRFGVRSRAPASFLAGSSAGSDAMASAALASGRQAEDALPPPAEPPLPDTKPQPPPVAAPQQPSPRPPSPAGVKEESYSFLPLVHNVIKW